MKILTLGDFHGKFPNELKSIIKKNNIDVVVSVGDYPTFSLGKLFFKYVYGNKNAYLWDFVGKERYKQLVLKDIKRGENVLKKLNELPVPVISALGNHDYPHADDVMDVKKSKKDWNWDWNRTWHFSKFIDKLDNVHKIDYSSFKLGDYIFVGARGHSFPGRVKSKAYARSRRKLEELFRNFSKENKQGKVILVTHVPLYKTRLDLITAKDAHEKARGKHYGSKLFRRIVEKYQPILHLCGHIEESKGVQKIRKTTSVNSGSVHHGEFAVIDIDGPKSKIKSIKFHKIR